MATYAELHEKLNDGPLLDRISVAVLVLADTIKGDAAATIGEKQFAAKAFSNPMDVARSAIGVVLATNKDNSIAQIDGATDAQIQTAVDAARSILVEL